MTDNFDQTQAKAFVDQIRARVTQPMPLQQQRELALCHSIDRLWASLAQMRGALETAQAVAIGADDAAEGTSAAIIPWAERMATLGQAIEQADRDGMATILAVRTLLQV